MSKDMIAGYLQTNRGVLLSQTKDMSNADSLLQTPFQANCANWVLGHINVHRSKMIDALTGSRFYDEHAYTLYDTGSAAITSADDPHMDFATLLEDFANMQNVVLEALEHSNFMTPYNDKLSTGQRIAGLAWHESYHIGQFEFFRRLAGKTD